MRCEEVRCVMYLPQCLAGRAHLSDISGYFSLVHSTAFISLISEFDNVRSTERHDKVDALVNDMFTGDFNIECK